MSEKELVNSCLKQDRTAQRVLYDRFANQMMALCVRYAGNQSEAQDMLQEGFIKVFEKLEQFRGDGPLGGWIRRVMVNEALIYLRKQKKHAYVDNIDDDVPIAGDFQDGLDVLATEDLLRLIAQLPDGYRTVFNLYAVEGYSHKEIAEQLGISENTSKTQFHKAKLHLRKQLEYLERTP